MKGIVEERAVELGEYIVQHKATVRTAAKQFGISKSTVHKDEAQRHIRGGLATRMKYQKEAASRRLAQKD